MRVWGMTFVAGGAAAKQVVVMITAITVAMAGVLITAPAAHATKGDYRSCVTTKEYRAVKSGMSKAKVKRILDGKGAKVNKRVRQYPKCGTSSQVVRVKYSKPYGKRTAKVARKWVVTTAPPPAPAPVYRWRAITDSDLIASQDSPSGGFTYRNAESFEDVGAQWTNGVYTARTLQGRARTTNVALGAVAWSDYSLKRSCTEFSALVGMDDDSEFGGTDRLTVFADGRQVFSRDFTNDQSQRITLPVSGVLRLRIQHEVRPPSPNISGFMALNVGNAKALCR